MEGGASGKKICGHCKIGRRNGGIRVDCKGNPRHQQRQTERRRNFVARIAGVDLPNEKRIEIALTYIYGIGRATAQKILSQTGVSPDVRVKNLSDEDTGRLRGIIERELKVEGALRSEMAMNIK